MVVYHKTIPLDARVFIDYDKKEVDFEYPQKPTKWETFKAVYLVGLNWWMDIFTKINKYVFVAMLGLTLILVLTMPPTTYDVDWIEVLTTIGPFLLISIILTLYTMAPPLILVAKYYLNPEEMGQKIPIIMAESFNTRYVSTFTKTNSNYIKIPIYTNTAMDYWLKGGFKNQIKSVEVREIPGIKKFKYEKGKLGKEETQKDLWEVIFTFKAEPKDGKLVVSYM